MTETGEIDIGPAIRGARLNATHVLIVALCTTVSVFDGFDTQLIAYAAPVIAREWGFPLSALGTIFSAGMVGLAIGACALPILADKFGRKPLILVSTGLFALVSILTPTVDSYPTLLLMRALAGLGLGAALPNVVALVSEYAPNGMRVLVNITLAGFGFGALICGLVAAWLIPAFGWRAMFYVGGAIPLLSLIPIAVWLPESLPFLVLKGAGGARIGTILAAINPARKLEAGMRFTVSEAKLKGFTVAHLFRERRGLMTLVLWIAQFMNLFVLLFMLSWTPSLMREAGLSLQAAIATTVGFSVGGVIGAIVVGRLMDRFGPFSVLASTFIVTAGTIGVVASSIGNTLLLQTAVCLAGFGVAGCQNSLNTLSGMLYPTAIRSTGVGWAMGIGRIGSIIGPFIGGSLVAAHWDVQMIIQLQAIPMLIGGLCIVVLRKVRPAEAETGRASTTGRPPQQTVGIVGDGHD